MALLRLKQVQRWLEKLHGLQPKILIFTCGASLMPVMFLVGSAWYVGHQPLKELEEMRLNDQMLAFQGYTAASAKGLQDLAASYAFWTDLYTAVQQKNRAWIKTEVSNQLVFSTDIDAVKVVNQAGEVLGSQGFESEPSTVQARINTLIKSGKAAQELLPTTSTRQAKSQPTRPPARSPEILMLSVAPVYTSDGKGTSPGTLVVGQVLDQAWLKKFLTFSQPTTKLKIFSLQGKPVVSSTQNLSVDDWEATYFSTEVIPKIQQGQSIYRLEPESGLNAVYAPLVSGKQPIAIAKIQIVSGYYSQALTALNRLLWVGLAVATLLSLAIARLLARQIGQPIRQLAERSKTLAAGDLSSPIPGLNAGGELGQLATAYQEMADSLKTLIGDLEDRVATRTQELELARQTLEDRVRDRTEEVWQKHQQLQQAHDELQRLNAEVTAKADQLSHALGNLQKAQAHLIQTEKMSSLGQLVAGVAHEINNPVNFIYGNLPYISRYMSDLLSLVDRYSQLQAETPAIAAYKETIEFDFITTDLPKILASMQTGADRIRQIIISLRNFSRLDEADMKQANLHEGLDNTLVILQHRLAHEETAEPEIKIIKQYGNLPSVECHPRQLNQVFMNILSNAIDALEASEQAEKQIVIQTQLSPNRQVRISIHDNGPGIPAELQDKLFDPFFTTKPVGKGTGLGLTVAYQILEQHHGHLQVISQPGQGTTVVIDLPRIANALPLAV